MPRMLLTCIAMVLSVGAPAADSSGSELMRSYERARAVLDGGVAAMGGVEALTALTNVTREYESHRTNPGQGPRPVEGVPSAEPLIDRFPVYSRTPSSSVIDYLGQRFRLDQRFQLSASSDEWLTAVDAGGVEGGYSTIAYREEIPVYTVNTASAARSYITLEMRSYPEAILRAALRRPATLQWLGDIEIAGRRAHAISFVDDDAFRIALSFDQQTRLLVRSEVLSEHPYIGQAIYASAYMDYRKTGRLMLPYRVELWRNDEPTRIMLMSRIELDGRMNDALFAPPRERIDAAPVADELVLTSLGQDVYAAMGGDNNVVFAVFPDYVVLIEAPRRESHAKRIFELIRSVAPGKPVRLVSTHFHEDHIGGVRYAVSQGAEIWTTAHAKSAIERTLAVRWTIRPDEFGRAPRDAKIHVIDKKLVFEAGNQRVEVADVGPTEHADQMLAAFFPRIGTLYTADIWDVPAARAPTPGPDAARIVSRINALGWKVQRMVPTHGVPATVEELNRSLEVRAKYVKGADARDRLR